MLYVRVYYAPFTDSAPIRSPICNIVYIFTRRCSSKPNELEPLCREVPAERITVTYYKHISLNILCH